MPLQNNQEHIANYMLLRNSAFNSLSKQERRTKENIAQGSMIENSREEQLKVQTKR